MVVSKIYVADQLRDSVVRHLKIAHPEFEVVDMGTSPKYYEVAYQVGGLVDASRAAGGADRAVLCCGTGMGMSIISNKFPNVWAAVVESVEAAGNAAAINNANVLTIGAKVFKPEEAAAAVDKWLGTKLAEGYDDFKDFLQASMTEIPAMLCASSTEASSIPFPSVAFSVDGQHLGGWQPVPGMGLGCCVWCKLREDVAAAGGGAGTTRVRALVRFPGGCTEQPHHHSCGHDVLVLSGSKTVHNLTTGQTYRLGPLSYLYTLARQVHSVTYHTDTLYFMGCDSPFDLQWQDEQGPGLVWESEAARLAADKPWRPADSLVQQAPAAAHV